MVLTFFPLKFVMFLGILFKTNDRSTNSIPRVKYTSVLEARQLTVIVG